ncbi:MAG: CBS domain-containing protein [Kofleriaceae bacterium]
MACPLLVEEDMINPADVAISELMTRSPITAPASTPIEAIAELMTRHHISCVPIVDDDHHPTGIVTKLDLIECRDAGRTTAREIMMPHAMTLPAHATLATAASLMSHEGFHHVLVVDTQRALLGVLSTFDIARWVARQS